MNVTQPKHKKEHALKQLNIARSNLLLMIVLTAVNIALLLAGSESMMLFSATIPYMILVLGVGESTALLGVCGVIAVLTILPYVLCWVFSKKHYGWMIAALVLFCVDTLTLVGVYVLIGDFSGIIDLLVHIWVLYYLIIGVKYGHQLAHLTPEEEEEYAQAIQAPVVTATAEGAAPVQANSPALRMADIEVKARILIEGDFVGHHIAMRRVKRVNELVIDGYVYDDIEMLVETPHELHAAIDGYSIAVGFDSSNFSYISVNGQRMAKKLRLI